MGKLNRLLITIMTVGFVLGLPDFATAQSGPVTIASGEWQLHADWQDHTGATKRGTVLLLHKAAGNRAAYGRMATVLAEHGYASLRIDLRGHGDSTNVRAFDPNISRYKDENDPAVSANFELIDEGYIDIVAAIRWLDQQGKLHGAPFAVIGSSYTGEQMAVATDEAGFADAYIALAPGNFSEASIRKVDPSGKPWLFVRAEREMSFFDDLFTAISDGTNAEIWVLPGRGHATDLFETNDGLEERLVTWLDSKFDR